VSRTHLGRFARRPCPVCGQTVLISRSAETVRRHRANGAVCAGSGMRVDLYGSGPASEVTP